MLVRRRIAKRDTDRECQSGRSLFVRELMKYTSLDCTASDVEAYLTEYWASIEDNGEG